MNPRYVSFNIRMFYQICAWNCCWKDLWLIAQINFLYLKSEYLVLQMFHWIDLWIHLYFTVSLFDCYVGFLFILYPLQKQASCRRNFSLDVILMNAFGHPVHKEIEVLICGFMFFLVLVIQDSYMRVLSCFPCFQGCCFTSLCKQWCASWRDEWCRSSSSYKLWWNWICFFW